MSLYKNALWTLGGTIGTKLIGMLTDILLARFLSPEYFGVIGIASVIIGLIFIIQDTGLSSALVQRKEITNELITTTFYCNLMLSVTLSLIVFFSAPFIASWFNEELVSTVLYFSLVGILVGSLGITNRAVLIRNKQFKKITKIDMLSELISSVGAIVFIFVEQPIFAVGFRIMFRSAIQSVLLIINNKIDMNEKPKFSILKDIFPYSSNVLGVKLLNFTRNNIDYFLIGTLLGSYKLGLYTVSFQWSMIARFYISQSVSKVAFPEISRNQDRIHNIRSIYISMVNKISFITFPMTIGLALVAPDFVEFVYGDKWKEAVEVLQILMVAGMISSIGTLVGSVFSGMGKPNIEFRINVFSLISFVVLINIGAMFDIKGVAIAVLINTLLFDTISISKVIGLLELKVSQFLRALAPSLISAIGMATILIFFNLIFLQNLHSTIRLFAMVVIGAVIYFSISFFTNKETFMWALKRVIAIKNPQ
jgi:PST family polysaccharide transporter